MCSALDDIYTYLITMTTRGNVGFGLRTGRGVGGISCSRVEIYFTRVLLTGSRNTTTRSRAVKKLNKNLNTRDSVRI